MGSRTNLTLAAAGLTVGLAAWVSGASLDVFETPAGAVRVALFPAWWRLGWSVAPAIGAALGAGRLFGLHGRPDRLAAVEPLCVLNLLLLPYLPWLSDWVPALAAFAGRGRWLVWGVVLALAAWKALETWRRPPAGVPGPAALPASRLRRAPLIVVLVGIASFGLTAARLAGPPLFPGGDEPHYLVIAQSLWRDHDLAIDNNHERGDYHEYYAGDLEPHFLARGTDGRIYSVHPIGLPVLLAPVYALGGYGLVVAFLVIVAAVAGALMWRAAARLTTPRSASFAWVGVALAAPFLFNSFTVYPEIMAALAVLLAFTLVSRPSEASLSRWVATGVATAALPWLSTKYAPMAAVLAAVALWRIWRWSPGRQRASGPDLAGRPRPLGAALAVVAPFAVSLAGWFLFFHAVWGSPLPTAAYGTYNQTSLARALVGGPGLLFDQEHGLLAFAPLLVVAATGLWTMARAGGEARTTAIEIAATGLALLVTVGAFWIWWGGDAMPARPVASGVLLLGLPIAWRYHHTPHRVARTSQQLLLLVGLSVSATLLLAERGMLLATGRDGVSEFLRWLSPDWHLWALAPSFIVHPPFVAAAHTLVWLAVAMAAAIVLRRLHATGAGRAGLLAAAVLALALVTLAVGVPRLFGSALQPGVDLGARSRVLLLDRFDAARSSTAIVYDPWRPIRPAEVPGLFAFRATPGSRRARQPLPVLLNMRLALPPGEYTVRIRPAAGMALPVHARVGLQVGRLGEPLEWWDVTLDRAEGWRGRFTLPIGGSFVGFRGETEAARAVGDIEVRPLGVVDRGERPAEREVLAAASWAGTRVFFHDGNAYPEEAGAWIRGRSTAAFTLVAEPGRRLTVALHCGPKENAVRLETPGWQQTITLAAGESTQAEPPATRDGVYPITVHVGDGFVPADVDPRSRDRRLLGCWVESR